MDSHQRGRESGRGHGYCRGRGRGVREEPIATAPIIIIGPTSRGALITLGELSGSGSELGVLVSIPTTSTATGGRGRGKVVQEPVETIPAEASGPTDGGVQATVINVPRDAEPDRGEPIQKPEAGTAVSGRGRGGRIQVPLPNISTEASGQVGEGVQATVINPPTPRATDNAETDETPVQMPEPRTAAGGRGRGGIQVSLPNTSTDSYDPAYGGEQAIECGASGETRDAGRGRGIRKAPPPIVSTASGPAGRGVLPNTSEEVEFTPTPGLDAKEEDSFKIVEKEPKTLQDMFEYKFKSTRKGKSDRHIICENWAYAKGINRPVMVVSMNEYVNSDDVYIPGEIVITPFTLKYGIDLMYTYWTRVDPGENIPPGHEMEASNNVTKFDLLKPGTPNEKRYKDYERIAQEMKNFVKKNSTPAFFGERDESGDVYFLFCKKEMVDRYTKGMNWLFALGGKEKFPFKLLPLETILVVLSLGGLELEAARRGSVLDRFQEVVEKFNDAVNLVVDSTVSSTEELMQTAQELLSKFTGSADPRKYVQRFLSLGGKSKRLACRRLLRHPYAFLGAFMLEDQAAQYLDTQEYMNEKGLACAYHKESDKMRTCAQLQAARMIYFALDVLLVNYGDGNHGIRPREGKHFPLTRDY